MREERCRKTCAYLYSCSVLDSPELWSEWMLAQLTFKSSKPLEKSHTLIPTAAVHEYVRFLDHRNFSITLFFVFLFFFKWDTYL